MTLKLGIQHVVLEYYLIYSNNDTGLTLTIFMIWPNLFPNGSAWVNVYTVYSHVFPSVFSISYALRWAIQDQWSSGFINYGNNLDGKTTAFRPFFGSTTVGRIYDRNLLWNCEEHQSLRMLLHWIPAFPMKIKHNWKPLFSEILAVIGCRCLCCALANQ